MSNVFVPSDRATRTRAWRSALVAAALGCSGEPAPPLAGPVPGVPRIDLSLVGSVSNETPTERDTVVFSVIATNDGPLDAVDVFGSDTLQSGLRPLSDSTSQGTFDGQSRRWSIGDLRVGDTVRLEVRARMDSGTGGTTLRYAAGVYSTSMFDSVPENNGGLSIVSVQTILPPPPPPPPPGAGEPTFDQGTDFLLWSDNLDRYPSVNAMGACDAPSVFGNRTQDNRSNCANPAGSQYELTLGRTGFALRGRVQADPGRNQQVIGWLSPWPPRTGRYTPAGNTVVVQFWFRVSPGGTPGSAGTKWLELKEGDGQRGQFGLDRGGPKWSWVYSNPGGVNRTQQPLGPYWDQLNDGNWHRATHLYRANSSTTYCGPGCGQSSRDGRVAMWIDGQKILDFHQALVNVTPPGGTNVWCIQDDVDAIATKEVGWLHFPDVFNGAPVAFTIDHDDILWWVER